MRPSDLRTFAFCPRLYFFETHLGKEVTLYQKLKMLWGKIWHALLELLEEETEVELEGEFEGIKLKGRADAVRDDAVVEIKSGTGPRDGAWYGDYLQASLYAVALSKKKVIIKYRNGERVLELDVEELKEVLRLFELVRNGYLPPPKRSKWCPKCPYKDLCDYLGDEGDDWFPKLPYVKRA